ncbi:MAG: Holliday junction branch migration protein RuvA [Dehalococcoidia bacterium]|nr:Holliday junction branch migration protein RuvA [Dehalococcoidia bacterium]
MPARRLRLDAIAALPDDAPVITQLQGRLAGIDNAALTVEVEVAGVTYGVLVPLFLWPEIHDLAGEAELDNPGEQPPVHFHIYYHATQNVPAPVLVGFFRRAEREFFRKFTTVEGIGPLKAVKAMSVSVSVIARAIEQEDRTALAKLPGIGPRAADKVIATLRGKVTAEAAMQDAGIETPVDTSSLEKSRVNEDAVAAIVALGYSRAEARRWVR